LAPELKEQRRADASETIPILAAAAHDGWHHLVTRDESWLFLSYPLRGMWTLSQDDVATKLKHDIHTQKFVFTVTWNALGFQVVDKLPTGAKMNSDYFITNILEPFEQKIFPNGRNPQAKRLTVHLDNCSVHTSGASEVFTAEHHMIRLKHPSYSPDLAPSDFYLFSTIKERLTDIQMVGEEDVFDQLRELLNEIAVRELTKVFSTWIKRPTAVTRSSGSYISCQI
jgi:hypothetical protein